MASPDSPALDTQSTDTAAPEAAPQPVYDGPRCTKCEAPMNPEQMACKACGYYPSMGICVEIDQEWETANDTHAAPAAKQTALEEVMSVLPEWMWIMLGTNLAILVGCIGLRLALGTDVVQGSWWGVIQFVGCTFVLLFAHVLCFVLAASEDPDIGVFDLIASPLKAWKRMYALLPERLWLVNLKTSCITAILCAAFIVGGIPWERVWDWNIKQHTKTSLVDAITAGGGFPTKEQSLEDAVTDFASAAGNLDEAGGVPEAEAEPEPPKERKTTDCLIVGYNLDDRERIKSLLLATDASGRLIFAGELTPPLTDQEKYNLKQQLRTSHAASSFVRTGRVAVWVDPRFPVRVTYTSQNKDGRLVDMEWEEQLPELQLPW